MFLWSKNRSLHRWIVQTAENKRDRWWHYLVVFVLETTMFFISLKVTGESEALFTFLYIISVMAVCIVFGQGPSIAAGFLAAIAVDYHYIQPSGTLMNSWESVAFLVLSLLLAQLIVGVMKLLREIITEEERLRKIAVNAIDAREKILGIVAHDLRQPLSTVAVQVAVLQHLNLSKFSAQAGKNVEGINRNVFRLNRMIEDLLDFSRIDSGQLKISPVTLNLAESVREVVEAFRVTHPETVLKLELPSDRSVPGRADPDRLQQILGNLITNAINYGARDREIIVSIRVNGNVRISVTNFGEAIPADQLENIFGRFVRASESRKNKKNGLGLGLFITRGLVEAQGGSIWATSNRESTCFTFTLPISERLSTGLRKASFDGPTDSASRGASPDL